MVEPLNSSQLFELLSAPVFWRMKGCDIWKLATGFTNTKLEPPREGKCGGQQYFELSVYIGDSFYTIEQLASGEFLFHHRQFPATCVGFGEYLVYLDDLVTLNEQYRKEKVDELREIMYGRA